MVTGPGPDQLFDCTGEMAQRFASFDWSSTPLGPVEQWPASLRTTCAMMLRSRFPMILSWGHELVMLYNDAYIPTLGAKHPEALGGQLPVEFAEIWDAIGPMQRSVLAGGDATFDEDLPLVIERGQGPEETFFTFSYSHVPATQGPGGVLAVLAITTGKVVGARRLALLNALASGSTDTTDPDLALARCLDLLGTAGADLVHGAAYAPDDAGALVRGGAFGEVPAAWPDRVDPADPAPGAARAVATAWREGRVVVGEAAAAPPGDVPAPTARVALPVRARGGVAAVLLVAPHPLRPLDEDHRRFLDLLGDEVSQVVSLATARADEQARIEAMAAIDAAKTELLSSVSHEFRTPLTLLLGPLEDVLDGRPEAMDLATVRAMHQGAHRLLRMVNDLLDVARLDAGGPVVDTEPTDVAGLSADLLRPLQDAAERAGLAFEQRLDEGIGAIETDPRLWEKILLNLVSNAVKYTHEGAVTVDLRADGGEVVLRVADTGVGIPEAELGRVFERFHRVPGTDGRSIDGTGLGLALVAEAAHALGGTATVASRPGEGSTFEVRLPLTAVDGAAPTRATSVWGATALAEELAGEGEQPTGLAAAPRDSAPEPGLPLAGFDGQAAGPTILVVDDNHAMRARLERVLSELGTVVTCADGEEALEVLHRAPVDLVVTDVMMPRLDGVGLLQAIRGSASLAPIPVVVVSARAGAEAASGALEAGADDYVVKPFTRGELLARSRTSLELARLRTEAAGARERSSLVAGVSRDIQSPLAVVRGVLDIITEQDLDQAMRDELGIRALTNVRNLDLLVRQFLDWSHLAVGVPITAYRETTDLSAMITEVADAYLGVEYTPPAEPVFASCDPGRTLLVLDNLIGNAVRAARSHVTVLLRPMSPGLGGPVDSYEIEVRDDGSGIPEHVLPYLFSPFSPSSRANGRGTGIGLNVSREAARAQGGDLVLVSSDQRGSCFSLRVRAASPLSGDRARSDHPGDARQAVDEPAAAGDLRGEPVEPDTDTRPEPAG